MISALFRFRSAGRGFTVIELLIVVAIVAILAALSLIAFNNLRQHQVLERDTALVRSMLELARSHTLASRESDQYGVYFSEPTVAVFQGDSYSSTQVLRQRKLDPMVTIEQFAINGNSDSVVFSALKATTTNHGTIVLKNTRDNATSSVTIKPTGLVE